jgi:hypothetical protein
MFDRVVSSLVALSLALLVWLYARSRDREVLDNVTIPVNLTLAEEQAEHYGLEINGPSQVAMSFTGPPACIRDLRGQLQHNELSVNLTLAVPESRLNESRYSDTVHVEASDVHAPPGVTPLVVEGRNRIAVTLHKIVEKPLKVRFDGVQEDAGRADLKLEPEFVVVRGPQEVLEHARWIATEPAEPPTRPGASVRVALLTTLEGRAVHAEPAKVTVRVPPEVRKEYVLPDVPVQFLCPADFTLRPEFFDPRDGRVTVRVQGPARPEPPKVSAFIDLTHGQFLVGANHEPLQLQLPKDFQPADEAPRIVPFNLQPADFVPRGLRGPP